MKFFLFQVLLLAGCGLGGLYGAVVCQLSYTLSPDYFHHLTFPDYDTPPHLHNRLGAALVGWSAGWGVGACPGVPLLALGLILFRSRAYLTHSLRTFGVVALTASAFGIGGLCHAYTTAGGPPAGWHGMPEEVTDRAGFERVRVMHESIGAGGFLGFFSGTVYLLIAAAWHGSNGTPTRPAGAG
jgi:hypothetical protein